MIKLKNDIITNIIDDSWSQENKSEFTDFGTTINTDLFFEFENNNNFRFKQSDGLSPFEISMWLINNIDKIKQLNYDEFISELEALKTK